MIIRKLKKIYYFVINFLKNNNNYFYRQQTELFNRFGLDRKQGKEIFNKLKSNYKFLNSNMHSEHQIVFSSISINMGDKIKKILEIGTFDGSNAFLLSKLFPKANILTIDLPNDNKDFKDYYGREDGSKLKNFIESRDKILEMSKNLKFKQLNSLNLTFENDNFDLIWIDGAHGFPFVTIDILNAVRLCNKHGIIMCDDIFTHKIKNPDKMYFSNAAIETFKALAREGIIKYDLFLKRLENKYNYYPQEQKFIALVKKL